MHTVTYWMLAYEHLPPMQVVTTDARVTADVWRPMVLTAVNRSFNQITVCPLYFIHITKHHRGDIALWLDFDLD